MLAWLKAKDPFPPVERALKEAVEWWNGEGPPDGPHHARQRTFT